MLLLLFWVLVGVLFVFLVGFLLPGKFDFNPFLNSSS